jgi:hypothetical protein
MQPRAPGELDHDSALRTETTLSVPRRFTLLDAMVLIAATALALAIARQYTIAVLSIDLGPLGLFSKIVLTSYLSLVAIMPFPLAWSLALFVLGLWRTRRPRGELTSEPGIVASGAVALVVLIRFAGFLSLLLRTIYKSKAYSILHLTIWESLTIPFNRLAKGWITAIADYSGPYFSTTAFGASSAVAVAWLLLVASDRWRPQRHWLDRAGRLLGAFWIAIIPFSCWWDYNVFS